jgi:tetratricopeptide (TPR) repeat protein
VIRFGLGNVYTRQEKVGLALYHFQRAASLHPTSSVLLCHVGVVCNGLIGRFSASFLGAQDNACPLSFCQALQSLGRSDEALLAYSRALELQPSNIQALYHRSVVYQSQGMLQVRQQCICSRDCESSVDT